MLLYLVDTFIFQVEFVVMPLEKRSPEGGVSEGVNSLLCARQVVSGTVQDIINFYGNCDALLRGLSRRGCQTFIHKSAIVRLRANCFSPRPKTNFPAFKLSNFPAAVPFVIVVSFHGS